MVASQNDGDKKVQIMAGLEVFRHDDYVKKLKDFPDGTDDRVMEVVRRYITVFRRSKRKSGLIVAVLDPHFSPGYKGPAAEVLLGAFRQFVLLDIRVGGFSEEELMRFDELLAP